MTDLYAQGMPHDAHVSKWHSVRPECRSRPVSVCGKKVLEYTVLSVIPAHAEYCRMCQYKTGLEDPPREAPKRRLSSVPSNCSINDSVDACLSQYGCCREVLREILDTARSGVDPRCSSRWEDYETRLWISYSYTVRNHGCDGSGRREDLTVCPICSSAKPRGEYVI